MFGRSPKISPIGGYTSEVTDFLRELVKNNPSLEQQQREGRALLWDKQVLGLREQFLYPLEAPKSPVPQRPEWG